MLVCIWEKLRCEVSWLAITYYNSTLHFTYFVLRNKHVNGKMGPVKKWPKKINICFKVIYPKYSKYWPYTVASTIDCGCSKMLNHGLNHGFFLSLFKLMAELWCPALFFKKMHFFSLEYNEYYEYLRIFSRPRTSWISHEVNSHCAWGRV